MKRLFGTAAASLALIVSPIAQAADAGRAQAPIEQGFSEMGGRLPLSALIALIAIIAGGIYIIVEDDEGPDSP